jgi:hypothetical protein
MEQNGGYCRERAGAAAVTQKIYIPGDPRTTRYMDQLKIIFGLIEVTTHYYLTSADWGRIIAELDAQFGPEMMMDPSRPAPWKSDPNRPMRFGVKEPYLYVHNAGTDDEQVVYLLNEAAPMVETFGKKRDALRIA